VKKRKKKVKKEEKIINAKTQAIRFTRPEIEEDEIAKNPFIIKIQAYIDDLHKSRKGKVIEHKIELMNMRNRNNISHSGITKEMDKIRSKIRHVEPTYQRYEMLKSYLFFYQKKLSLDQKSNHSDEIIDQRWFNMMKQV
jgi:hypothetical protein